MKPQEVAALAAFLDALNDLTGSSYAVVEKPDKTNRLTKDVDARAECEGLPPLAIEHTILESFDGQYATARAFSDHIAPLEAVLNGLYPYNFDLVVPHETLLPGTDRNKLGILLEQWFRLHAGDCPCGHTPFELPGIHGEFLLCKRESNLHKVFTKRTAPGDLDELLRAAVADRLEHKYAELQEYRLAGHSTALVLHSEDIALIHEGMIAAATTDVLKVEPREGLDQIWFVWSLGDVDLAYCLIGPEQLIDGAEARARRMLLDL